MLTPENLISFGVGLAAGLIAAWGVFRLRLHDARHTYRLNLIIERQHYAKANILKFREGAKFGRSMRIIQERRETVVF